MGDLDSICVEHAEGSLVDRVVCCYQRGADSGDVTKPRIQTRPPLAVTGSA